MPVFAIIQTWVGFRLGTEALDTQCLFLIIEVIPVQQCHCDLSGSV